MKNRAFVDFLTQRVSQGALIAPGPSEDELKLAIQSAFRAPDHMRLLPSRYILIDGEGLERLGELFFEAKSFREGELENELALKVRRMPLRAPMILVAVCHVVEHPKVPAKEQLMSTAVGVGYALLSLRALGYGGIWRTGEFADDPMVHRGLGLKESEHIVGFLYLGTPKGSDKRIPAFDPSERLSSWQ